MLKFHISKRTKSYIIFCEITAFLPYMIFAFYIPFPENIVSVLLMHISIKILQISLILIGDN